MKTRKHLPQVTDKDISNCLQHVRHAVISAIFSTLYEVVQMENATRQTSTRKKNSTSFGPAISLCVAYTALQALLNCILIYGSPSVVPPSSPSLDPSSSIYFYLLSFSVFSSFSFNNIRHVYYLGFLKLHSSL